MKKSGLGRGLDVLLPSLDTDAGQDDTRQVPIHLLDPNPFQPRKTFTQESLNALADSIRSAGLIPHKRRGGFEIQVNVVDRDTLLKAQKNPEAYRDLVVRIGGYSDYFVKLSPQMQAEVLQRTAHEV